MHRYYLQCETTLEQLAGIGHLRIYATFVLFGGNLRLRRFCGNKTNELTSQLLVILWNWLLFRLAAGDGWGLRTAYSVSNILMSDRQLCKQCGSS